MRILQKGARKKKLAPYANRKAPAAFAPGLSHSAAVGGYASKAY
jgi:hypothetical protein